MITIDAEHVYHDSETGNEIPNVTSVLEQAGLIDSRWFDDYSRDRGTAVHAACALSDRDDLEESSVDPEIEPYLQAWHKFREESGFLWGMIEEIVHNETYGYAGTLDRLGSLNDAPALLDIKSGRPQPWSALQTAAYAGCLEDPCDRFVVELRDNGTYRLTEYADPHDWQTWLACLTVTNWKRNGGK